MEQQSGAQARQHFKAVGCRRRSSKAPPQLVNLIQLLLQAVCRGKDTDAQLEREDLAKARCCCSRHKCGKQEGSVQLLLRCLPTD